jgi:hypothetical protein
MAEIPGHYRFEQHKHRQFIDAVETLGKTLKEQGPLDTKTSHLVQMAASIAIIRRAACIAMFGAPLKMARRLKRFIMPLSC